MSLRTRILASPETLSELAWAAEQRFIEAETLINSRRLPGAVYLFGIASEIWLKLACFGFLGNGPASRVDGQLGPAKAWMQRNAPSVRHEGYHSLQFWADYLVLRRVERGNPLPKDLAGQLRHHVVNRLFWDWKVDVRYRVAILSDQDGRRVHHDAGWVRNVRDKLWR